MKGETLIFVALGVGAGYVLMPQKVKDTISGGGGMPSINLSGLISGLSLGGGTGGGGASPSPVNLSGLTSGLGNLGGGKAGDAGSEGLASIQKALADAQKALADAGKQATGLVGQNSMLGDANKALKDTIDKLTSGLTGNKGPEMPDIPRLLGFTDNPDKGGSAGPSSAKQTPSAWDLFTQQPAWLQTAGYAVGVGGAGVGLYGAAKLMPIGLKMVGGVAPGITGLLKAVLSRATGLMGGPVGLAALLAWPAFELFQGISETVNPYLGLSDRATSYGAPTPMEGFDVNTQLAHAEAKAGIQEAPVVVQRDWGFHVDPTARTFDPVKNAPFAPQVSAGGSMYFSNPQWEGI